MQIFRIYTNVLGALSDEKPLVITLVTSNLALACAQFAEPVLFGRIIDRLTLSQNSSVAIGFADISPLILTWAGFGLFIILAAVLVALHSERLAHRRRLGVMARFFEHVMHLPFSFHSKIHSGRVLKVMLEGANGMSGLWLSFFRDNCASFAALFVLLPMSVIINWRLGSLLLFLVLGFGTLTSFVLRRTETLQQRVERFHSDFAERATDALGNIPVIQSFTRIEAEARDMRAITANLLSAQMPVLSWWAFMAVATRASATLTILAIFITGTWLHFQNLASIGEIVTFMGFATMLIGRLEQVVGFINFLFLQVPKLQEFFDILETEAAVKDHPGARDIGRSNGVIGFENVDFSYDARRKAVDNVELRATRGETIALVGATGSGKSTTLSLLHRVYDVDHGRITLDGLDLRDITLKSLRQNIGVVFQEPMLFARSIEENLRVGKPDATPEELALALERAQAADFVARQPDGLATIVGERGRSLSGGERQRIAIARALLKDPPIMIFDEATSALDANTERELQAALDAATQGRTTFVIAHRLATIQKATRILMFDQGKIIETGTFDELLAKGGKFATLAKGQFLGKQTEPDMRQQEDADAQSVGLGLYRFNGLWRRRSLDRHFQIL